MKNVATLLVQLTMSANKEIFVSVPSCLNAKIVKKKFNTWHIVYRIPVNAVNTSPEDFIILSHSHYKHTRHFPFKEFTHVFQ